MMIMAIPLAMVAMGLLYFWDMNPLIVGALHIIFIIIYKSFYWIPYHVDFALFTNKKTRGRQLSILLNISEIALVLTPLFGGYVIATYGFGYIFIISPLLFLITIPPLFSISNPKEKYSFTYLNTFKQLFKKKNRPILVGYSADGAQSVVAAIIWPIFIFQLFNGEYLSVGIVTALTLIAIVVLRLLIGDIIDRWNRSKMITIGSIFYTTGWIIKIFVETAFQVFLVDTYHNIGKTVNRITFDTNTYTQSADNGHYIDEFTSLKEIALNIGRITMLSFVAVIVLFATIKVTFIAAAIATLFMTIINRAGVIK
jgi:hypothetical protein